MAMRLHPCFMCILSQGQVYDGVVQLYQGEFLEQEADIQRHRSRLVIQGRVDTGMDIAWGYLMLRRQQTLAESVQTF